MFAETFFGLICFCKCFEKKINSWAIMLQSSAKKVCSSAKNVCSSAKNVCLKMFWTDSFFKCFEKKINSWAIMLQPSAKNVCRNFFFTNTWCIFANVLRNKSFSKICWNLSWKKVLAWKEQQRYLFAKRFCFDLFSYNQFANVLTENFFCSKVY